MTFNITYLSVRSVIWLLAAGVQALRAGQTLTASISNNQPSTLTYLIAASTGLFAIRDVWLIVTLANQIDLFVMVLHLLDAVGDGVFLLVLLLISSGYWYGLRLTD
jgi:hypothetical protein